MYRSIVAIIAMAAFCGAVLPASAITIDGNFDDWAAIPNLVEDPQDIGEPNGDIKSIKVLSADGVLYAQMTVYGLAAPPPPNDQRYYYHLLIDADNDLATGYDNSSYEDSSTGVVNPIGVDYLYSPR